MRTIGTGLSGPSVDDATVQDESESLGMQSEETLFRKSANWYVDQIESLIRNGRIVHEQIPEVFNVSPASRVEN